MSESLLAYNRGRHVLWKPQTANSPQLCRVGEAAASESLRAPELDQSRPDGIGQHDSAQVS